MDLGEGDCMQCVSCKRKFDEFSFMNIMFLEKCSHIVCRLCFKSLVRKVFAKGKTMCCPQCQESIPDYEIKAVIGEADFDEIQKEMLMAFVDKDNSTISCTCGAILTVEEGVVDYNQKDDKGQVMSKEVAEHMSRYRIRCRNCQRVFCTGCAADLYHLGKTCEDYKNF